MERIIGFFLEEPRRIVRCGRTIFTIGGAIILFGLFGMLARTGASVSKASANVPPELSLASLYPQIWTWWIPETLIGALPALIIASIGIWLAAIGRQMIRAGF